MAEDKRDGGVVGVEEAAAVAGAACVLGVEAVFGGDGWADGAGVGEGVVLGRRGGDLEDAVAGLGELFGVVFGGEVVEAGGGVVGGYLGFLL